MKISGRENAKDGPQASLRASCSVRVSATVSGTIFLLEGLPIIGFRLGPSQRLLRNQTHHVSQGRT